ncbi:MAG: hypothetical protein CMM07_25770 [Rhodopirellula sp.]|nr:hypothetical protein [Rhodopirellula sp.]
MRGQAPISGIYKLGEQQQHDPDAAHGRTWSFARRLWAKCGIVVIWPRSLPEELRKPIVKWANSEYGRSPHGKE